MTASKSASRHFDKEKPDYYRDLLKKNELELLAIHVGGNFLEPDSVQKQIDQFGDTLRFACELGIHYIFISGFPQEGQDRGGLQRRGRRLQPPGQNVPR